MAFGTQRGFLTGSQTSIGTALTIATGTPFAVKIGDLIYVVASEQVASGNGTCTTVTDNLHTPAQYTQTAAQLGTGTIACKAWYFIAKKAGTISSLTVTANGGTNNGCAIAVGVEGAFELLIDKNPANITTDVTSPFTCPLSGTLSHAIEVVVGWGGANFGTVFAATSPNILVGNATTAALGMAAIGIQTTSVTTSISPVFTAASNPGNAVLGTSSFAQEQISPFGVVRPHWDLPRAAVYPTSMRGFIQTPQITAAAAATVQPGAISYRSPRTAAYPTSMLGWISPATTQAVVAPTAQYDWPLPRRTDYRAGGWVQDAIRAAAAVTTAPFAQYDWPLPRRPNYPTSLVGFIDYDSFFGVDVSMAFNQFDWPLPQTPAYPRNMRGWIQGGQATSVTVAYQPGAITYTPPRAAYYPLSMRGWISPSTGPSPVVNPFAQYDWPLPRAPAPQRAGWITDAIRAAAAVTPPFAQYDWPLPRQARYQAAGWISDAVKIIGRPFAQYDWPPPRAAHYPTSLRGFTAPSLVVSVRMGFNAYDWPLPRAPHYPLSLRGLIDYARFSPASFIMGFNQYSWPLPQRSPPLPQSWFNPGIMVVPTPPVVTQLHYRQPFGFMGVFTIYDSGAGPPPPVTFYLLQEDGSSRIILENASGLLELEH